MKKKCGGVPTEDLSNESNEKSNVQKSLLSKKNPQKTIFREKRNIFHSGTYFEEFCRRKKFWGQN